MSDNFLHILSIMETEDQTGLQYTTNEQMLLCISKSIEVFESIYPDRKSDINNFFSLWEQLFNRLNYDTLNCTPKRAFQWSMEYPFLPNPLYTIFNIDAILDDSDNLLKTSLRKTNLTDFISFPSEQESFRSEDMNKPIIICDSLSAPILIDGSHRFQNAVLHKLDIPMYVIPYMKLSKQYFINEFNYAVFIYIEEVNSCFKSFDSAALMRSYLRIGNKFII